MILLCLLSFWPSDAHWPQWRGPNMDGVAHQHKIPTTWSETQNILWKKPLAGFGLATPAIWGDKIFLLTTVSLEEKPDAAEARRNMPEQKLAYEVLCLNRKTGDEIWKKTALERVPHESTHRDASWASASPATDGEVLIASFGSAGIFAYDLDGNQKWTIDLGDMRTRNGFGEGSSPALYDDFVVVNWDHEDQSFIACLDKNTGKEIWRKQRDEPTSWSTPVITNQGGVDQVIVSATNKVQAYNLKNGDTIWTCSGMTLNAIPSPIVHNHELIVTSGFRGSSMLFIDLNGANGDLTESSHVKWSLGKDTPYVPSALRYQGAVYFIKSNSNVFSSVDDQTGQNNYGPMRLDGISGVYASLLGANNHVYIFGRQGNTHVVKAGKQYEFVASNSLDDRFDASPAVAENVLFLRGHQNLYAIGN